MTDPFHTTKLGKTKKQKIIWFIRCKIVKLITFVHGLYLQIFKIKLTRNVTDTINSIPCVIEYRDKNGRLVGFWSYGSWHGDFPYHGQY